MYTYYLLKNLAFHENRPFSEPLFVSDYGRVLRFTLKPGQSIKEHRASQSPFFAVVVQGEGVFTGKDGNEVRLGEGSLVIFAPGEAHAIRAENSELMFIGFMEPVPGTRSGKISGRIVESPHK